MGSGRAWEWNGRQAGRQAATAATVFEEGKACCVYLTFPQLQVRLDVKIGGIIKGLFNENINTEEWRNDGDIPQLGLLSLPWN